MPDRFLLDRFEEYLTDEADELTANTGTPFRVDAAVRFSAFDGMARRR